MTDKYAVVDSTGIIVNMIKWDGVTPFNQGEGLSLVPSGDEFIIGGRIEDGNYFPPGEPEETQPQ